MKKNTFLSIVMITLCTAFGFSQSFNYQAVVRNVAGDLVTNQSIGTRVKLLQGGPSGTTIYTEIHTVSSSNQGVIALMIGSGTTEDVFTNIDWSSQNYWLEIAVDITGGTTYTVIGTSQLLSVPYANYALSGVFAKQADPDGGGNSISNTRVGATPLDEDFIFGSSQIQDIPGADDDARMFFNKSRASFRAGSVEGNFWDYSNQGSYSAAFGIDNIASGIGSFVSGSETEAAGQYAIAMGDQSIATGDSSVAIGNSLTAESMAQISLGSNNTVVSGNVDEYILTDRLFVVGNGISAAQKSDALVILKNGNTTLNGELTIDGDNQGAGTSYTLPAQDGTANQVMSTDGSGNVAWVTTPASTGVLSTVANVTSNAPGTIATDDFVFGSTQLNNDPTTMDDNAKLFFDKSKAAFRVGNIVDIDPTEPGDNEPGDQWDDSNIGVGSIAMGEGSIAAAPNSIAIGNGNTIAAIARESVALGHQNRVLFNNGFAIGSGNIIASSSSLAFGLSNTSSGLGAIAMGFATHAGSYSQTSIGLSSTEVEGTKNSYVSTDRLFVIGNGISSLQRRDALVMLKNGNTTLNGQLTIDGDNTGVGTSYTLPAQDGTINQVMTTDGSGNVNWAAVGGAFSTIANITSNASGTIATDDFVFGSTQLNDNNLITEDNSKLYFDKDNSAFRAGIATSQWDVSNSGFGSVGFGSNTTASGSYTLTAGQSTVASGNNAVAYGNFSTASGFTAVASGFNATAAGNYSSASGNYATASGNYSFAHGNTVSAESYGQVVIGSFNTIQSGNAGRFIGTDRLFVIGNGTASGGNESDALVVLKNGNTTLNGQLTIDGDNTGDGASYTLPAQDGTANQVMSTDGSGNVSWADNTTPIEAYTAATLNIAAGWQYYNAAFGVSTFQDPRYRIVNNVVYLEGLVRKNAAIINGDTIMTLPTGYRPQKTRIFSVETENGTVRVDVNPNGSVIIATGFNVTQNWVSLDGITFSVD